MLDATAMSKSLYGRICSTASSQVNQSVVAVTVSPANRRIITSSDSSMRGRCWSGSMPSIIASEVSWPGPAPNIIRPTREVVEHHDAIGQDERVVVRQRVHPGAEFDVLGAFRGGGDEHLRAGDQLRAGGVVLTDPGLGVAEPVQVLHQLEVALQRQCRVDPGAVHRWQEDAEAEGCVQRLESWHGSIIPCTTVTTTSEAARASAVSDHHEARTWWPRLASAGTTGRFGSDIAQVSTPRTCATMTASTARGRSTPRRISPCRSAPSASTLRRSPSTYPGFVASSLDAPGEGRTRRKRRMDRVEHDLSADQWAAVQEAWGGCAYCGESNSTLQRDCVLPVSRGGRYTLANVVPACRSCNSSKCNSEVTGWLRRKRLDERTFLLRHVEIGRELAQRFDSGSVTE